MALDLASVTASDYPFRIPPYFAILIRAIGVLQGEGGCCESLWMLGQQLWMHDFGGEKGKAKFSRAGPGLPTPTPVAPMPTGIALVNNPSFNLVDAAYPYIARRLLTDPAPRLREALKYILYGNSQVLDAGAHAG